MDDLISRQSAIETLSLYRHSILSAEEIIELIPTVKDTCDGCHYLNIMGGECESCSRNYPDRYVKDLTEVE